MLITWLTVLIMIAAFTVAASLHSKVVDGSRVRKNISLTLITCAVVSSLVGCTNDAELPESEEDIKTVAEVYSEAYKNTAMLEDYSMEAEISLKKLVVEAKVSGIVKKQDGVYTGSAVLKLPAKKYTYAYSSPYNDKDTNTALISDGGNKYLSFNIANIGEGVICPLPDEIVETGEFTNKRKTEIEFSVTNDQAYELYGEMIDYFKTSAAEYIDLSDMIFTSGSIELSVENDKIKDYTVTLKGDSRIGKITCRFACTVI